MQQAVPVQQPSELLRVIIPQGCVAGHQFRVAAPDGTLIDCVVPTDREWRLIGYGPGMETHMALPPRLSAPLVQVTGPQNARLDAGPPLPPRVPWVCSQCTLETGSGASVCSACAGPSPVPPPAPRVEASASMDPMKQALDRLAQGPSFGSIFSYSGFANVIAQVEAEQSLPKVRLTLCLQLFLFCTSAGFVAISAIPWLNAKADTGVLFFFSPPPPPPCCEYPPSSPPPDADARLVQTVDGVILPIVFGGIFPPILLCALYSVVSWCETCRRRALVHVRVEKIEGDLLQHLGAGIIRLISVAWLLSQPPDWIAVRRQVRRAALQLYALRRAQLTSTLVALLVFDRPNSSSLGRNCRRKPF